MSGLISSSLIVSVVIISVVLSYLISKVGFIYSHRVSEMTEIPCLKSYSLPLKVPSADHKMFSIPYQGKTIYDELLSVRDIGKTLLNEWDR